MEWADLFRAKRELRQFLFLCKSGEWGAFQEENLDYANFMRVWHIAVQLGFRRLAMAMLMGVIQHLNDEQIEEFGSRYSEEERAQKMEKWISDFYAQQDSPFKRRIIERRLRRVGNQWKLEK